MRKRHREVHLGHECPGNNWIFIGAIHIDGVEEKMWQRVVAGVPVVCAICGNEYTWFMAVDKCPHCEEALNV